MGLVSFIRDSGENIFFRDRFEKNWSPLEIFECALKFVGHVSFIGDSGRNIFFRGRLELFGNFRVRRKISGPG